MFLVCERVGVGMDWGMQTSHTEQGIGLGSAVCTSVEMGDGSWARHQSRPRRDGASVDFVEQKLGISKAGYQFTLRRGGMMVR